MSLSARQRRRAIPVVMFATASGLACAEPHLPPSAAESLALLVLSTLAGGSIPAAAGALLGALWGQRLNRLSGSLLFPLAGSLLGYGAAISTLLGWLWLHDAWPRDLFDPQSSGKAALILAGIPLLLSLAFGIPTGLIIRIHGTLGLGALCTGLVLWMTGAWFQTQWAGGTLLFLFLGCAVALLLLWGWAAVIMFARLRNLSAAATAEPDGPVGAF